MFSSSVLRQKRSWLEAENPVVNTFSAATPELTTGGAVTDRPGNDLPMTVKDTVSGLLSADFVWLCT